jgi:hypothetical protein
VEDKITFDATEPPNIGVGQHGITWQEVEGYIRVAHNPVLTVPPGEKQYRGVYWDAAMATVKTTDDLGTELSDALRQFRAFLRQPQADGT